MPTERRLQRMRRLTREVLEIITNYTSGRGTFSNMPPGYTARSPNAWLAEFAAVYNLSKMGPLSKHGVELNDLIYTTHRFSMFNPFNPDHCEGDGMFVHGYTVGSTLGYMVLEMLIRELTPALDQWGCLTVRMPGIQSARLNSPVSQIRPLLQVFERSTAYLALRRDLRRLNKRMISREIGRGGTVEELNLYRRLEKGRNLLLHGNITHSFECHLLVLLIDLVLLHVMIKHSS
jgi:hypothetical protein